MKTRIPAINRQRGATLVIALILLLILTILGVSTMSTATMEMRMAANSQYLENAFQLAETGIETTIQGFNSTGNFPAPGLPNCPPGATMPFGAPTPVAALLGAYRSGTGFCGQAPDFSGGSSLGKIDQFHYRIDSQGIVQIRAADGCCITATLCSGSIVLRRAAWLRIRVGNARPHCELIRRDAAENKHWRRLQGIWRHLGARS